MTTSNDLSSCKYDVFISFRGEDTRHSFTSHLYGALEGKKILAYKDDVTLQRGDEISPALRNAIKDSRIYIVVFSENYASSKWCLDELVHILKCKRERGQIVLPVFYKVDPSHVRKQKRSYAEAFVDHEKQVKDDFEKVNSWRSALEEAGNFSGWDSSNRSEFELVQEIAQVTLLRLNSIYATNAKLESKNLVGIEEHVDKIVSMLCFDPEDVRIVGIWGMGGIGKTTLADVVYKRFSSQFESCYFEDVSDKVKTHGQSSFLKEFFGTLLNDRDVDMKNSMKDERLQRTKVFVVLDNVDDYRKQLEFLDGESRFGKGSRIILTSRNKKLLEKVTDVIYEVESLDPDEALQLFSQNAFRRDQSNKIIDFIGVSKKVVDYTKGHPLALKVLGSYLHSRSIKQWESALIELRKAPNEEVQNVLKISFDALDSVKKSILLDIGCFFKFVDRMSIFLDYDRTVIEEILGEESHIGINVLEENCLITINEYGQIRMHDLIQEMVWEIIRRESVELGQRSRLWNIEDIIYVLEKNKGSSRNQVIFLDTEDMSKDIWLQPTVFEAMENLRMICINVDFFYSTLHFDQGLEHLPDSLRYLCWPQYPLESLPPKFEPQNLVRLEMQESKLNKLWDGVKRLDNLMYIDLRRSVNLIELSDPFLAPKLERLNLGLCESLRCIPKINGNLIYLNLIGCKNLKSLPDLPSSLQHLNLSNCKNLKSLPDFPCSLQHLDLSDGNNLESLPDFPSSLKHLNLRFCNNIKFLSDLPSSLQHLNLVACENLESLTDLPSSLQSLYLNNCIKLKSLPDLPSSLQYIDLWGCVNLESLPEFPSSLEVRNFPNNLQRDLAQQSYESRKSLAVVKSLESELDN